MSAQVDVLADDRPLRQSGWYTIQSIAGPARVLRHFDSEARAREDARRKSHYGVRAVAADRLRIVEHRALTSAAEHYRAALARTQGVQS